MSLRLLALSVGLLGTADAPKDDAVAKDTKALQDTWVVTSAMTKRAGVAVDSKARRSRSSTRRGFPTTG
jgi:hypothetical protein